ncbi:MAG: hypothetical protein LBD20_02645 [Spirochaetaceae bacterium]|jgi:hypothetical protein|nr:hypothetical protein [Spirochaetaceae bacterium]
MYNYLETGDYWGTLIIILVGFVILFLILREFWCWYWKLNKIVSLLEGQNQLLALVLGKSGKVEYSIAQEELNKAEGALFVVEKEMKLYNSIRPLYNDTCDFTVVKQSLNVGDTVEFIKEGGEATVGNDTAPMFLVRTKEGNIGWCFSGYLKTEAPPEEARE